MLAAGNWLSMVGDVVHAPDQPAYHGHVYDFFEGFSKLYQITYQTQLSRLIALRHYTSRSTDSAGNNNLCDVTAAAGQLLWKHSRVDTSFLWAPRWLGE